MLQATRRLLQPHGTVKFTCPRFAILEFQDGGVPQTARLLPSALARRLACRNVPFELKPYPKGKTKTEATGLRLCTAIEATGTLLFYDPLKGIGRVVGKDGKESLVHHSHVTDLGDIPTKLMKGDPVEFDVQPGEKGLVASKVRVT